MLVTRHRRKLRRHQRLLGDRLMVGQRILTPSIQVRVLVPQPKYPNVLLISRPSGVRCWGRETICAVFWEFQAYGIAFHPAE